MYNTFRTLNRLQKGESDGKAGRVAVQSHCGFWAGGWGTCPSVSGQLTSAKAEKERREHVGDQGAVD